MVLFKQLKLNTMEKFKVLKQSEKSLTWLEIKQILNGKNDDDLNTEAYLWKIDNEECTITGHNILEVLEAEEDQINPSGEGIEPVSTYEPHEIEHEPIIYKKGALLAILSN